jgi:hypothetical protein
LVLAVEQELTATLQALAHLFQQLVVVQVHFLAIQRYSQVLTAVLAVVVLVQTRQALVVAECLVRETVVETDLVAVLAQAAEVAVAVAVVLQEAPLAAVLERQHTAHGR